MFYGLFALVFRPVGFLAVEVVRNAIDVLEPGHDIVRSTVILL